MAPADSPDTFERTTDGSVLLHSLNEVAAARWLKAAGLSQQWTQKDLVKTHQTNQKSSWNLLQCLQRGHRISGQHVAESVRLPIVVG